MTAIQILTLPECQQVLMARAPTKLDRRLRDAVEWAVAVVGHQTTLCMVCAVPIDETAAYAVLRMSNEPGWEVCAGGICGACGAAHPRGALLEHCRACEALLFSQAAGHA